MQPYTLRHRLQRSRLCIQGLPPARQLNVENKARRTSRSWIATVLNLCVAA